MNIDLKKLVNQYNLNLTDKLRGFGEEEFLKFWVPDTDNVKTVLNLIDALYESNTLEAHIQNINFLSNDLDKLSELKDIAYSSINKNQIIIKIDIEKYKNYKIKNKSTNNLETSKRVFQSIDVLEPKNKNEEIDEFYINASDKRVLKNYNENLNFDSGNKDGIYIINLSNSQIICLSVDQNNGYIFKAEHTYEKPTKITKIIDILCEILINFPLQEAAEHGTIRLEYVLRSMSKQKRKMGIFLPCNAGGLLNLLDYELRNIYKKFKLQKNEKDEINKYYPQVNENWIKKSFEEQKKIIENIFQNEVYRQFNINSEDIILKRVIGGNRLEFELSNRLTGDFEDSNLFKIEDILKNKIDNSIELLSIEEKDSNVLRLANAPKSN